MYDVYSLLDFTWLVKTALFMVAAVFGFYLPGLVIGSWAKIKPELRQVFAWIIGIVFWGLQAYVFGLLQVRWLTYLYILFFLWQAWGIRDQWWISTKTQQYFCTTSLQKIILVIGTIVLLVPVIGSGWRTKTGISYYWINGFDGLYHLSLSRALVESVPPIEPGAYDLVVKNYHYLSNLLIADLARVWQLPINHLYFQFLPVLIAVLLGLVTIALLRQWSKRPVAVTLGLVLFYGAGELSWIFSWLLKSGTELPFNNYIDSEIIQFLNPPQAFAKLVFLTSLVLLHQFWKKKQWKLGVLLGCVIASLVAFKVYFGMFLALGLLVVYLAEFFLVAKNVLKHPKQFKQILLSSLRAFLPDIGMGIVALCVALVLYLPSNGDAGLVYFDLLFWPRLLLGAGKIYWSEWWLRLQVYQAAHNLRALIVWYGLAAGLFLSAIFHLRMFGFLVILRKLRETITRRELVLLLVPTPIIIYLAMNYVQISGGGNIFNFFIVALTVLTPLTAVVFGRTWDRSRWIRPVIVLSLCTMMVHPGFNLFAYLKNYSQGGDRVVITPSQEEVLGYLAHEDGQEQQYLQTTKNAFLDSNTPYLYFFTGRFSYFGGRQILKDHNQPVAQKEKRIQDIFLSSNIASHSAELASQVNIGQVLLQKSNHEDMVFLSYSPRATFSATFEWKKEFENDDWMVLGPVSKN